MGYKLGIVDDEGNVIDAVEFESIWWFTKEGSYCTQIARELARRVAVRQRASEDNEAGRT